MTRQTLAVSGFRKISKLKDVQCSLQRTLNALYKSIEINLTAKMVISVATLLW
jgi:hypothetical protein